MMPRRSDSPFRRWSLLTVFLGAVVLAFVTNFVAVFLGVGLLVYWSIPSLRSGSR